MRKNKKLLLASVAAMGALALGVGATSTFAWYTASTMPSVTTTQQTGNLLSTSTSISLGEAKIVFTVQELSGIQLTNKVSDNDPSSPTYTLYKGMVSGQIVGDTDKDGIEDGGETWTGAVTNGSVTTKALNFASGQEDYQAEENFIKTIVVTVSWASGVNEPTPQQKAALAGKTITYTNGLKANGQAKLRANQNATGDDASAATLSFTVPNDGTLSSQAVTVSGAPYVRVQAVQTDGDHVDLNSDHASDNLEVQATNGTTLVITIG